MVGMKITIIGASGLIGTKLVELLTADGHDVVAASRNSGVDVLTGEGLADALDGANVLIDVVNSPSFEDEPVMKFFTTSTTNQAAAAKKAGVGHYVALSIVGLDGLPDSGYLRAKVAQEKVITESGLPYTIVRATQFAEFTDAITESLVVGDEVHVPDALIQPIAADQVASEVATRRGRRAAQRLREHRWAAEDLVRADGPRLACAQGRRHEDRRRRPEGAILRDGAGTAQPGDARLAGSYLISASTVPWVMAAPASTARPVMVPSLWAVTGFSIFIASSTTTRSPAATS